MIRGARRSILGFAALLTLLGGSACWRDSGDQTSAQRAADYAAELESKVTVDAVMTHVAELQKIADASCGTRVAGSPGYDASVEYVAKTLRDKGFDVSTPEFDLQVFNVDTESLTVAGKPIEALAVEFSKASPAQGVTGPLVFAPTSDASGCKATDYDGLSASGAVVVVERGTCYLDEKSTIAAEAGAVAMILTNNVDEELFGAYISQENDTVIPLLSASRAVGAELRSLTGDATVVLTSRLDTVRTKNVIAQTKTGATENVVMVGAHLDSVRQGPGINDNGSGVAAVLETARQMGSSPDVANAVRIGFWCGEEHGLRGSQDYIGSLDDDALKDIALYLNYDMIASANACYFTSDGNQSSEPDFDIGRQLIPEGSPGIERTLVESIRTAGQTPQDKPFDGRSDYDSFTRAGIPVGNFDTGADEVKTAEEVQLWGGTADQPCDPYYHSAEDTLAGVNRDALALGGGVVGYVVGLYAQDETGRNGVPIRDDRTRHQLPDE